MLHITFSNRFESLLDALLENMAGATPAPFDAERIIVPSQGVRRRLELALADRFGICCNVRFSFLAQWLWQQIGLVIPVQAESPFAAPVLAWRVFQILDDDNFVQAHARLAAYLSKADPVMRFHLASQTATLLEQYITYRPDWLARWADKATVDLPGASTAQQDDQRWQAALWRRITQELGTRRQHPAVAFFRAVESLGPEAARRAGLPQAAHVFCLTSLPPLYIDILNRLSRFIDLHLYVLNPCREYWFEIVDPRRLSYLATQGDAAHQEVGNRLLAKWGKQTQAHIDLLFDATGVADVDEGRFVVNEGNSLLAQVQNAILDLCDLVPASVQMTDDDRSIEVHVCHSLTRELEVLQDQLLAMFAGSDPPRAADIVVVTPNLEEAAPLIDAVFGTAPTARRIPFTITGRPRSTLNPAARALFDLLGLINSRFTASAVIALLQQALIAQRFGIGSSELAFIQDWMRTAAIRWGLDAAHRTQFDVPEFAGFSFADGLDRLFLGYALPSAMAAPFQSRLPAGDAEGLDAVALGCFWNFIQHLQSLQQSLRFAKTPEVWMQALSGVLTNFLLPQDEQLDDLRELQDCLSELQDTMSRGGIQDPVTLDVIQAALEALLDDPGRGGTPSGAVTFASLSSLRNLPFRVVCIIGLNDGIFPSPPRAMEFDLLALAPRRGDRQRSSDERNLFLDLLLAARERLYLSYTGRSVRDNASLPPSVVIADLLDYLVSAIASDPASPAALHAARQRLIVEHPLQAFALAYFQPGGDTRLSSFNDEYCDALKQGLRAPTRLVTPNFSDGEDSDDDDEAGVEAAQLFFPLPLPEPETEWRDVSIDQLIQFFGNPCRYLLNKRLGIHLARTEEELPDDEPFTSDWPSRQAFAQRMLPFYLAGQALDRNSDSALTLASAGHEYPPGQMGAHERERELKILAEFAQRLSPHIQSDCVAHDALLEFDLDGQTWRLSGAFGDLRATGLVRYRYDDAHAKDYLAAWLTHLFMCATHPEDARLATLWHARDSQFALNPCAKARDYLRELLLLYRQGLCQPLHFFPKSAWEFMCKGQKISAARSVWRSTPQFPFREDRDAAFKLALRGIADPLAADFEQCANTVFGPLIEHLQESVA